MPQGPRPRPTAVPFWAYVLASALLWAAFTPLADWVRGDLRGVGRSAVTGAVMGGFWGSAMFAFEKWLRGRHSRTP